MKRIALLNSLLSMIIYALASCCNSAYSQRAHSSLSIRVLGQIDYQKSEFNQIEFPFSLTSHSATTFNWGIDGLYDVNVTPNLSFYFGLGYFRNKFNFRRQYLPFLSGSNDSVPIGVATYDYTYHIFRIPVGIRQRVGGRPGHEISAGLENVVNFSFNKSYHGSFNADPNTSKGEFRFYGNSLFLQLQFSKSLPGSSTLHLIPYVRILNWYNQKDEVLKEEKNYTLKAADAIGVSLKYSIKKTH